MAQRQPPDRKGGCLGYGSFATSPFVYCKL